MILAVNSIIIAVGSTNEAKVLAVKESLLDSPSFLHAKVISVATDSGVSDQPLSLQETIQGAKNRAKNAFNLCDSCKLGFGIESGLIEASDVSTGFLHTSACSIYDGKNYYTGLSTSFEVPPKILELVLDKKMDLTEACLEAKITSNVNIGSTDGLIGILTNGKIDRKKYSKECVIAAILQLENAQWYVDKEETTGLHPSL